MIVGIDLGTTHSLIGCLEGNAPRLFPNALGDLLTPSAISVGDDRDYATSLYRAGAWLVIDGSLAQTCIRQARNLANG